MSRRGWMRVILFGFLTWAIPFVIGLMLYDREGQPLLSAPLVKSLMVVVGGITGTWLLTAVFRYGSPFRNAGLALGMIWLAINLGMDLIVLVPMTKMGVGAYFADIGLRYLIIPVISIAMEIVATGGDRRMLR
ncbi:MAG: hypothetical protein HY423_06670 [Candidatus Lambdaproteobacteria bacterium]|nr:hypothetical protein [Candidatus Lambdaproteobacteria bacterium]